MRSTTWLVLLASIVFGAGTAAAQGQCEDVCNQPTTYCAATVCYDGSAKLTCKVWQGSPPCAEPLQGTNVIRYPDSIRWPQLPLDYRVSSCFGNCGAGCTDAWNPCGGPQQYWALTYLTAPTYGPFKYRICLAKRIYRAESMTYRARGRWSYHGYTAPGCVNHDNICPEWTLFGCVLFAGCGSPKGPRTWYYDLDLIKFNGYLYGPEYIGDDESCIPGGFWPGW
jgi:hypothetical protein